MSEEFSKPEGDFGNIFGVLSSFGSFENDLEIVIGGRKDVEVFCLTVYFSKTEKSKLAPCF